MTAIEKAKWRLETLKKILQNEKYIGDTLLQKTYTVDFLSKKRVKNNGIVPQYYVENSHEAIIPCDSLYAGAGGDDAEGKLPQWDEKEETDLQQQVRFIKHSLLLQMWGYLLQDRMEQLRKTFYGLAVQYPWSIKQRNAMHQPIRSQICKVRW